MTRFTGALFIIIFSLALPLVSQSDQEKLDSLAIELRKNTNPYKRIDLLLDMAEYCKAEDNLKYSLPAIKEIDKALGSKKDSVVTKKLLSQKANALQYTGYYYSISTVNDQIKAIVYYRKAMAIYRQLKMQDQVDQLITRIETSYSRSGNLYMQLQTLKLALEQATADHDKITMARYIYRLAQFYVRLDDTVNTGKYAEKGVALEREINDPARISRGYYLGGSLYSKMYPQKSITYFNEALKRYKKSGTNKMIALVHIGIGEAFAHLKNYQKAKENFKEALNYADTSAENGFIDLEAYHNLGTLEYDHKLIRESVFYHKFGLNKSINRHYPGGIATSEYHLGKAHFDLKEYKLAKEYAVSSLILMKQIGSAQNIMNSEKLCYRVDSAIGNYKDALFHYIRFVEWREKINSETLRRLTMKEEMNAEIARVKAVQEKKDGEAKNDKRRQIIITLFTAFLLLIVLVFLLFVFRSLKVTKKQKRLIEIKERETLMQKHLVEEKQKEILDSITYAKRLQQAILPPPEFIDRYLQDYFILYKPKDIVAGDFYWAEKIGGLFFIAAADSTGHGVPGAMVSLVCANALNRSVKEFGLVETGKILDKARELVIETFEKSNAEVKDGMDISLLCIDQKNQKISWSGANNPLWYINDAAGFSEIKANKQPIGKTDNPKPFTTHQIEYRPNTTFYLFTDGLADQFGGPNGKKFKYKQFSELLIAVNSSTSGQQQDQINLNFEAWKGDVEQVDDICVIGVKL